MSYRLAAGRDFCSAFRTALGHHRGRQSQIGSLVLDSLALVEYSFKFLLHLFFVLDGDLSHALEVGKYFFVLIDLFDDLLPFCLVLINVFLELGDQCVHLVLVNLLFGQLGLKNFLALGQLLTVLRNSIDFAIEILRLTLQLNCLLGLSVASLVQFVSLFLDLGACVCRLTSLLLDLVRLSLQL